MVLSARVASSVMISEHVHVVHGVGSVTCQALTCLSIARKNRFLNSLSFWLGSFMGLFAEFLSEGNVLVHLPLQVLTIYHILPASLASWRHLCAYLCLALVKACLRQQEANLCSVGVFTVHASVWVALYSSFYHFSPFGHGGCVERYENPMQNSSENAMIFDVDAWHARCLADMGNFPRLVHD